jgi:nitrate reductase gamma subunit
MRDQLLFAAAPYIATLALVTVCAVRYVYCCSRPDAYATPPSGRDWCRSVRAVWGAALAIVALGHLVAFAFPDSVLLWNRQLSRLVLLEVTGVIAGSLASAGVLAMLVRIARAPDSDDPPSPVEVIARTLVLVGMLSGIGIALFYRWASSWSEVTLVPYLYSVARLEPATALVTHMPLLVKLHVACAFAIVAVFPFTDMAQSLFMQVDRLMRSTLVPVLGIARGASSPLATRIAGRLSALCARVLRNSAEEN